MSWAEAIAKGITNKAVEGDVSAARELRESTEGKTPDRVMVGGLEDAPPIAHEMSEIDARLNTLLNGVPTQLSESSGKSGALGTPGAAIKAGKKS